MDEIVVRIARTIACTTRLRILSYLARADEVAPARLADELGVPAAVICIHLRRLSSAGLILRRRSGVWHYCAAGSPYSKEALSGRIAAWLSDVLKKPARTIKTCGAVQLSESHGQDAEAQLHEVIFEAATAFTNVRRLQILRRLASGDAVAVQALSQELSMSESALSRHTTKLMRRGYLSTDQTGRFLAYRLARRFKSRIHADLFKSVAAEWQRG